jgi:hypothetical protein
MAAAAPPPRCGGLPAVVLAACDGKESAITVW